MDFDNESPFPSPSSTNSSSPSNPYSTSVNSSLIISHKRKAGRRKFQETRHPIYRGVRRRNGNKWVCEVREPNKKSRLWLGTYPTPEMAARAHDVAVLALRGSSAVLNFPDSPLLLPLATSSSATDIRRAAAKAAEAFRPSMIISTSSSEDNSTKCEEKVLVETNPNKVLGGPSINIKNNNETLFLDEEALYNMPGLLDSMAEGLLLTPPSLKTALNWDNIGSHVDLTLWRD